MTNGGTLVAGQVEEWRAAHASEDAVRSAAPATMTSEPGSIEPPQNATAPSEAALRFLQLSARLLLEYNVRSRNLERSIERIARHVGVNVQTVVGYREVTLALADGRGIHARAPELRINVAVSAGALQCHRRAVPGSHRARRSHESLETLERLAPRHGRWVVVVLFGLAASAIAWLLRADSGAIVVSGVSSAVGLIARQELARRSVILFAQPFAAGLIGAVIGGAGDPSGLDSDAGLVPDRSGADARAGPASHQQRARHAGQPHADGRLPPGARHGHPHRHRARRRPRWLAHARSGDPVDVAVRGDAAHVAAGYGAGRRGRLRVRRVLQRAVARPVGVDPVRHGGPWSALSSVSISWAWRSRRCSHAWPSG